MKKFTALVILIVAIGSHVNYQVEAQGSTFKYGFELAEGFDIQYLYEFNTKGFGDYGGDDLNPSEDEAIAGINNDIVVLSELNRGIVLWYKSDPRTPDSIPVDPKVIVEKITEFSKIVSILPAGKNSIYLLLKSRDDLDFKLELFKVTGPFEPAGIFGSSFY